MNFNLPLRELNVRGGLEGSGGRGGCGCDQKKPGGLRRACRKTFERFSP
jgi:hypothetical protein